MLSLDKIVSFAPLGRKTLADLTAEKRFTPSEATLETWHHMLHVWHVFEQQLPEAREAFEHIGRFLELCAPRDQGRVASG